MEIAAVTDVFGGERSHEDLVGSTLRQRPIDVVAERATVADDHLGRQLTVVEPSRDPRPTTRLVAHLLRQLRPTFTIAHSLADPDVRAGGKAEVCGLCRVNNGSMGRWVNGSIGSVSWMGHMGHGSMHFHP